MCVHSEAGDVCIMFPHKETLDGLMVNTFDLFLLTFHPYPSQSSKRHKIFFFLT